MASAVETQRLISVSLGKIARSRAQRGGINLHKNLLVASVLNKARTAFMMENYSYQLSQQQHQVKQASVQHSTPSEQSVPASVSPSQADGGNSLPTHVAETCHTTPDAETRSDPIDTQAASQLVNGGDLCPSPVSDNTPACEDAESDLHQHCDKENVSPSSNSSEDNMSISTCPVSEDSKQFEVKQQCVSGEQHVEAANKLSQDAQLAGSQNNSLSYITLSPCKQQSSASTTCAGILKRRRENPDASQTPFSNDSEIPATKKARVSSSSTDSYSHQLSSIQSISSQCEYDQSDNNSYESDMQCSDSPQISNLVSIFNSGFSGLCNVSSSSSSSSSLDYDNSCYQSDSSTPSSHHTHHQAWSGSDSQSLHCSSMVERIGSISSAIVLSA